MELLARSQKRTYSKGALLLSEGEISNYAFKVIRGCLKSYVIDKAGKEHILQFAPEDWFISDMNSFFHEVPSEVFIEAIEETEVVQLTRDAYLNNDLSSQEDLMAMNEKLRNSLIAANKRLTSLLSASAHQRYVDFTETYPTLVQRLPLKLIASYIGITPEYLSEIRRKLVK